MANNIKAQAFEELEKFIHECRSEKSGEEFLNELARFYSQQSQVVKDSLREAFREWLKSGDILRAGWAIALMLRLKFRSDLVLLEDTLREINQGRSNLPEYFHEFLEPVIEDLKRNSQNQ